VVQPVAQPIVQPIAKPVVHPVVQPVRQPAPAPKQAAPAPAPVEPAPSAAATGGMPGSHYRATDRVSSYTGLPAWVLASFLVFVLAGIGGAVAWSLAKSAADDAVDTVDAAGRAAARALASMEYDWWFPEYGTASDLRKRAEEALAAENQSMLGMPEGPAKEELKAQIDLASTKLIRVFLADRKGVDDIQRTRNRERLTKLAYQEALMGVDLFDPNRQPRGLGKCPAPSSAAFEKQGDLWVTGVNVTTKTGLVRGRLFLAPITGKEVSDTGQMKMMGYAGVAISAEPALAMVETAGRKALTAGGAVLGLGFLAAALVTMMLTPMRRVLRDAEEFARGNFEHRPSAAGGGEIGALGRAVARMALTARDREAEALAKAAAAASPPPDNRPVVGAALAPGPPLRIPGWELEGTSRPCFEVAGDAFDYAPAAGGRLACLLVETSMRGLPAAFLAGEFQKLFRGMAPHHDSASVLLDSLGGLVGPRVPENEEVHATVMIADPQTGATEIARAGKANPPVVWRAETRGLEKFEVEGPPVCRTGGAGTGAAAGHVEVTLRPRDRLAFVSDGLFRVRNSRKEKFGEQRLDGLMLKFGPMNSTAFVNMVVNEVDLFHEGASQRDDLTVLTVRRLK
jgi:HAMP domain-containing protein